MIVLTDEIVADFSLFELINVTLVIEHSYDWYLKTRLTKLVVIELTFVL